MAYTNPPKRSHNARAGAKKKIRPSFAPPSKTAPTSGLGPAYNSAKDPRGSDAYVPVPESRAASQHPNSLGQVGSKPGLDGRYHKGDQFLSYRAGSGEKPVRKPKGKMKRKSGDAYIG